MRELELMQEAIYDALISLEEVRKYLRKNIVNEQGEDNLQIASAMIATLSVKNHLNDANIWLKEIIAESDELILTNDHPFKKLQEKIDEERLEEIEMRGLCRKLYEKLSHKDKDDIKKVMDEKIALVGAAIPFANARESKENHDKHVKAFTFNERLQREYDKLKEEETELSYKKLVKRCKRYLGEKEESEIEIDTPEEIMKDTLEYIDVSLPCLEGLTTILGGEQLIIRINKFLESQKGLKVKCNDNS